MKDKWLKIIIVKYIFKVNNFWILHQILFFFFQTYIIYNKYFLNTLKTYIIYNKYYSLFQIYIIYHIY